MRLASAQLERPSVGRSEADGRRGVPYTWVILSAIERELAMPLKEFSVMDERLRLVANLLDGEATTDA